jgi:hypothetical protein
MTYTVLLSFLRDLRGDIQFSESGGAINTLYFEHPQKLQNFRFSSVAY